MKKACADSGGSHAADYETWKTQGCICGGVATRQRTCSSPTSGPPEWIPGRAHPQYPHVFAAQARDRWSAEDGYNFVRPGTGDLTVVWAPGQRSRTRDHFIAGESAGQWELEDGYHLDGTGGARWQAGRPSAKYPNVVAAQTEGQWHPANGYDWLTTPPRGDLRVRWVGNRRTMSQPNVVSADTEGYWRPASGYQWVSPGPDMRAAFEEIGTAVAQAETALTLNEYRRRLDEIKENTGYSQYERIETALKIIAAGLLVRVPYAGQLQRELFVERAKEEIGKARDQALEQVAEQLKADLTKMHPFRWWNPFVTHRNEVVRKSEQEILEALNAGRRELSGRDAYQEFRSGEFVALRVKAASLYQLERVYRDRAWQNR